MEIRKIQSKDIHYRKMLLEQLVGVFNINYERLDYLFNTKEGLNELQEKYIFYSEKGKNEMPHIIYAALLNFLASAKALVEHARKFIKLYKNTDLEKQYNKKIETIFIEGAANKFIEELRNYMLHYGLPYYRHSIKNTKEGKEQLLYLSKEKLLENSSEWSTTIREYISQLDEKIDIIKIISAYHKRVNEFYCWLFEEHDKINKDELEEIKRLEKERREFFDEIARTIQYINKGIKN